MGRSRTSILGVNALSSESSLRLYLVRKLELWRINRAEMFPVDRRKKGAGVGRQSINKEGWKNVDDDVDDMKKREKAGKIHLYGSDD